MDAVFRGSTGEEQATWAEDWALQGHNRESWSVIMSFCLFYITN